jgi:peroxiredoxin Q/BCP
LARLNTVVLGISTDKLVDQQRFTDKESLNFPLFADAEKKVTEAYGVLGKNGLAQRVTFVIDKTGVIRKVFTKVTPAKHPAEVVEFIEKELK